MLLHRACAHPAALVGFSPMRVSCVPGRHEERLKRSARWCSCHCSASSTGPRAAAQQHTSSQGCWPGHSRRTSASSIFFLQAFFPLRDVFGGPIPALLRPRTAECTKPLLATSCYNNEEVRKTKKGDTATGAAYPAQHAGQGGSHAFARRSSLPLAHTHALAVTELFKLSTCVAAPNWRSACMQAHCMRFRRAEPSPCYLRLTSSFPAAVHCEQA